MSYKNFVPTYWAPELLKALRAKSVFAQGCHNEFTGEITKAGDSITFNGLSSPTVHDVDFENRNKDIPEAEELEDLSLKMEIRKLQIVHFTIGDIDKAQQKGDLEGLMKDDTADVMADAMDKYIAAIGARKDTKLFYDKPMAVALGTSSATQISPLDLLDDLLEALADNNVPDATPKELIVPNRFITLLRREVRVLDTDNSDILKTGDTKKYNNIRIKPSNNLYKDPTTGARYMCIRTPKYMGIADALNDLEAYRPEKRFVDAIKAQHLYDAKIIRPKQGFFIPVTFDR